ncbi:MAG: hypothetical protein AAGI22_14205 [Planctomycetota bacterium]
MPHAQDSAQLSVTVAAIGMTSALGPDAASACAAARAGIVRAADLPGFTLIRKDDGEPEAVRGHAAHSATRGFEGYGRLLALARQAALDLAHDADRNAAELGRLGLYLAIGSTERFRAGLERVEVERVRSSLEEEIAAAEAGPGGEELAAAIERTLGWSFGGRKPVIFAGEHTAFAEACLRAARDIGAGQIDRAVVGVVDSLVDPLALRWLLATDRLKTGNAPTGLMPGEAGVLVLLEKPSATPPGDAERPLLRAVALDHDPVDRYAEAPPLGVGLARVLEALATTASDPAALGWVLVDQNGETFRGTDWGHAVIRLVSNHDELHDASVWPIAAEFGDTGAASGGVALCCAVRAFARGYAPRAAATIVSAADSGDRAALFLQTTGVASIPTN